MRRSIPETEVRLDEPALRALLRRFRSDLAEEPITPILSGWDNAVFRVGTHWIARLPRREAATVYMRNELAWLPVLAELLPLPVPAPVFVGAPSDLYPWPWSISPWLPGTTADLAPPAAQEAERFAGFLHALHRPAPTDAPVNPSRGILLERKAGDVEQRLERLAERTDRITPDLRRLWREALAAPRPRESTWIHGDLHGRNVLVAEGRITGVIDWGDVTSGDPALDLAGAWTLFETADGRAACLAAYAPSPARVARAKGWALFFGAMLLDTGIGEDPGQAAMGEEILRRLTEEI